MGNIQKELLFPPYFLASNTIVSSTNTMEIFVNEEFGKVRVLEKDGEPWFVAKNICECLELTNASQTLTSLDDEEKGIISNDTPSGKQDMLIISEPGLYSLVLRSRKPEAKVFKRWIVHEVIPSIRKRGGYMMNKPTDTPESIMARAVLIAHDTIKRLQEKTTALEHQANVDRPKVVFAESIEVSKSTILVGELAKLIKQSTGYSIGQKHLFEWMRDNGFLHKSGSQRNMPTQRSMERELFVIKEGCVIGNDGESHITKTSKVTGKGQLYFINRFKEIMEQAVT